MRESEMVGYHIIFVCLSVCLVLFNVFPDFLAEGLVNCLYLWYHVLCGIVCVRERERAERVSGSLEAMRGGFISHLLNLNPSCSFHSSYSSFCLSFCPISFSVVMFFVNRLAMDFWQLMSFDFGYLGKYL